MGWLWPNSWLYYCSLNVKVSLGQTPSPKQLQILCHQYESVCEKYHSWYGSATSQCSFCHQCICIWMSGIWILLYSTFFGWQQSIYHLSVRFSLGLSISSWLLGSGLGECFLSMTVYGGWGVVLAAKGCHCDWHSLMPKITPTRQVAMAPRSPELRCHLKNTDKLCCSWHVVDCQPISLPLLETTKTNNEAEMSKELLVHKGGISASLVSKFFFWE